MKILIYNVNWRGDVLFSTPAIRAIKHFYKDARLTCLVTPRCRGMLVGNPDVNDILCFDERRDRSLHLKLGLAQEIRKNKFDIAFLFHRSFTRALILAVARIPRRVGYATKGRGIFLTQPVRPKPGVIHKVDYFLGLARAVGAESTDRQYRFYVRPEDASRATEILKASGVRKDESYIVLNPGGNWGPKRWPRLRYGRLADRLQSRFRHRIVITGAAKDQALGEEILKRCSRSAVSLCGKTTLSELGAVMQRAQLVIANDTGPMHIAAGVGTRTLALFGPTDPSATGPVGDHVLVLRSRAGMEEISVDEVYELAQRML